MNVSFGSRCLAVVLFAGAALCATRASVEAGGKVPFEKPAKSSEIVWNTWWLAKEQQVKEGHFMLSARALGAAEVLVISDGKGGIPMRQLELAGPIKDGDTVSGTFTLAKKKWTFTISNQGADYKSEKEIVDMLASGLAGRNVPFDCVLADKGMLAEFRGLVEKEHSAQNLEFFEAANAYLEKPTMEGFASLFSLYLAAKAPKAINRSDKELKDIRDVEKSFRDGSKKFDAKLVDGPLRNVIGLVKGDMIDTYSRFLTCDAVNKRCDAVAKTITLKGFKKQ